MMITGSSSCFFCFFFFGKTIYITQKGCKNKFLYNISHIDRNFSIKIMFCFIMKQLEKSIKMSHYFVKKTNVKYLILYFFIFFSLYNYHFKIVIFFKLKNQ